MELFIRPLCNKIRWLYKQMQTADMQLKCGKIIYQHSVPDNIMNCIRTKVLSWTDGVSIYYWLQVPRSEYCKVNWPLVWLRIRCYIASPGSIVYVTRTGLCHSRRNISTTSTIAIPGIDKNAFLRLMRTFRGLFYWQRLLESACESGGGWLTHLPLNKMPVISQTTFSNEFSGIKGLDFE